MSDPQTQHHIDALKATIRRTMMDGEALWGGDVDGLVENALTAIGEWMDEQVELFAGIDAPYSAREKWLRFYFNEKNTPPITLDAPGPSQGIPAVTKENQ